MKRKIGLALATGLALLLAGCASRKYQRRQRGGRFSVAAARCGSVNLKKFQPRRQMSRSALGEDARLV